jgi:hypothetical protein
VFVPGGGGRRQPELEVDEVEVLFQGRSVVVHDGFYAIPEDGPEWQEAVRNK